MTFRAPRAPTIRLPGGARWWVVALVVVVVLLVLAGVFVSIYTNLLWYRSVGYSSVYTTRLRVEIGLFLVFGLLFAAIVAANIVVAYRVRPAFLPLSPEQHNLDRYRRVLTPRRVIVLVVVAVVLGVIEGKNAAKRWPTYLLWRDGASFHHTDPQFHRDVSYFAFTYPMQRMVLGVFFAAVLVSLLAAAVTHYLYGGLRLQTPGEKVLPAARAHLSVLLGLFVLLKAVAYWLDRYGLAFSPRGIVTGASYTDVNAVLPAKTILVFVALICAGLFFANVVRRNWTLPAVAFGLMVLSALVIGGLYPALVQQFSVRPNEAQKEAKYIQRNIQQTRYAYQLDGVQITPYSGNGTLTAGTLAADVATIPNVRLLDPNVLQATYQQLQQIRSYYGFPQTLDIDRYALPTGRQAMVVAVREVDQSGLQPDQRNWVNEHLVYTHGYGFVAAPANQVDSLGRPVFQESDIPPVGPIPITQPRVYFGELAPGYSITGTTQQELDRPSDTGSGQVNTVYSGRDGVSIGSFFRRLLYAVRFKDKNILFSGALTSRSRILYVRDPVQRVQKVAPYLTLDSDPYPAVVGGRIVWILDGYTTTDGFPYSERETLNSITANTLNPSGNTTVAQGTSINYIRNSVKATVDAYDGTVHLYTWDPTDPVLATWKRIFPGTVLPRSAIPPDLLAHFRYPADLFDIQRHLLASYHVTNAKGFYSKQDFWAVPNDPNTPAGQPAVAQPPYYLLMQVPGQSVPAFDLTTPLVFRGRPNLAAFVSVSSDQPDYGTIRVLQLPSDTQVNGPAQAANLFQSYAPFSRDQSQLDSGGSQVVIGNLLTLPVHGALIYIDPVYVQSRSENTYPVLQKVLVSYGNQIGYANTFGAALAQVFGGNAGASATGPPTSGATGQPSAALLQAIQQAEAAYRAAQAALAKSPPDFAAYGQAQQQLGAALARIAALTAASHPARR